MFIEYVIMFIELTDHFRCPADHDESFLVLLPIEPGKLTRVVFKP
jgi:hypothetical protein